jgi:hypothetical protein
VLRSLNDTVHQMVRMRSNLPPGAVASLADALSQGLGALLMNVDDATRSGTRDEIALLKQISADRSSEVDALRRRLIQAEKQDLVHSLTSLFERAVWLVQRYALLLEAGIGADDRPNRRGDHVEPPSGPSSALSVRARTACTTGRLNLGRGETILPALTDENGE